MAKKRIRLQAVPLSALPRIAPKRLARITAVRWEEGQYEMICRAAAIYRIPPARWMREHPFALARMEVQRATERDREKRRVG